MAVRLTFFLIFISSGILSQSNEYLIFFRDKPLPKTTIYSDYYDSPVSKLYLTKLKKEGDILNVSKWLNGIHYKSSLSVKTLKENFPFIEKIISLSPKDIGKDFLLQIKESKAIGDTNTYRHSFSQLEITQTISCLHDKGYKGNGVTVAVLDAGFPYMDTMLAFRKMRLEGRIVDTWDFEDNAANVYHKSTHGTYVTSTLGAELDSAYIGAAPKANYAFYITEIARFERNIEEFNLVLGLERADSIGADICSISLGYRNFDTLQASYGYSDMDGNTTIVAQGVNIAKNKGMIISVAAGNSGSGLGTISSPCDADSILCVGAVGLDSIRPSFSSEGPTFDGRIKPEVVSVGFATAFVRRDDSVRLGNGTSFATPLVSGLVACVKEAHPMRTNFQIIEAIKNTGHQVSSPDNSLGWGLPNGCRIDSALNYLDSITTGKNETSKTKIEVSLYPNPTTDIVYVNSKNFISSICIHSTTGKLIDFQEIKNASLTYPISIEKIPTGIYFVTITSLDGRTITKRIVKK